ncbi:unnamed protein product [Pleuronectes platessa]|uniref:Uncharacterized protein n=1 Tax=Pleuronectes platessa TaxID=8262 RepID=A0A9N7UK43_PLEPL|nr:unnamed protein product [Pleuronectes platessa]
MNLAMKVARRRAALPVDLRQHTSRKTGLCSVRRASEKPWRTRVCFTHDCKDSRHGSNQQKTEEAKTTSPFEELKDGEMLQLVVRRTLHLSTPPEKGHKHHRQDLKPLSLQLLSGSLPEGDTCVLLNNM